ncbi:MAG: hypothetical protein JXR54_10070 [Tannerellaceae bacterium]|nr:hypothetical protein [Tannerellaceae bacterium]
MDVINRKFNELCNKQSDIWEHLPVLKEYTEQCDHVTEVGVRWIVSTWAFLAGKPKFMRSYDIKNPAAFGANISEVEKAAKKAGINFEFKQADILEADIDYTDLLFIDTWHCGHQLRKELKLHAEKSRKYIILHDTTTFGQRGEDGEEGLKTALNDFLGSNEDWVVDNEYKNNNGLTVLRRKSIPHLETKSDKKLEDSFDFTFGKKEFDRDKKIKFIVPYPDVPYYCWQVLVQAANFQRFGYDVDTHYLCGAFNGVVSKQTQSFIYSDKIKSRFHIYQDSRTAEEKKYTASLKPWLMAQYFAEFPEEKDSVYVYLDPDVIFLNDIDWNQFLGDDVWYEADTRSYLSVAYTKSKGDGLLEEMCENVGVDKSLIVSNDDNCGGAQYVIKNNTAELWDKVWRKSCALYNHLITREKHYFKPEMVYWYQVWQTEMITTNWMAWDNGIETKIDKRLDFNWANHPVSGKKHDIMHYAGVAKEDGVNFCKVTHQSSPFKKEITCSKRSLSYYVVEEIKNAERLFGDIVWS